jgi:hypothetical protein
MDGSRFDRLTRLLAAGSTRRGLTRLLSSLAVAGPLNVLLRPPVAEAKKRGKKRRKRKGSRPGCAPQCDGKACDAPDGCGGKCNTCGGGEQCCEGTCISTTECCGGCDADLTCCDGACVDLATDGANCGGCGRSCLSNGCLQGTCICAATAPQCAGAGCICGEREEGEPSVCFGGIDFSANCTTDSTCLELKGLGSVCLTTTKCSNPCL